METKTNHDYTRRNRFTGESIELTKEEAEKHDKIFYHEALATLEDKDTRRPRCISKHWQKMRDLLRLVYEKQCQSIYGFTRLKTWAAPCGGGPRGPRGPEPFLQYTLNHYPPPPKIQKKGSHCFLHLCLI